MKIAVIAGTNTDTRMGMEYLRNLDQALELMSYPVSSTCEEQARFQYADDKEKEERIDDIFHQARTCGIEDFFIYCNSLAGAFDFDSYMNVRSVRVYTPLQIYRQLGKKYQRVAVIAAHNQSCYHIEEALSEGHGDFMTVLGAGIFPAVQAVEDGMPPEEIVKNMHLESLCSFFEQNQAECLVLGCTHFPYFATALQKVTKLKIIDPAYEMYQRCKRENSSN